MGEIQDRLDGDLQLLNLAAVTREEYRRRVRDLLAYFHSRGVTPEAATAEDVRAYLLYLTQNLHIGPANLKTHIAAVKFLYRTTLSRPEAVAGVRFPKVPIKLLDIPSPTEVAAVLAKLESPVYRTLLFCAYGAGLRVSEACRLCVGDIDSKRMVIVVRLRQRALRRPAADRPLPRPLHPPRRHLLGPPDLDLGRSRRLPHPWPGHMLDHPRRIHPPLPPPRPTAAVLQDPPLRSARTGQRQHPPRSCPADPWFRIRSRRGHRVHGPARRRQRRRHHRPHRHRRNRPRPSPMQPPRPIEFHACLVQSGP